MTVPIQNLRSGVASKRPVATGLAVGQIAINYNENDPAIYLRGDADALIKVSPTFVGSTAPNATPSGSSGNSKGETWLDTSTSPATLKIWNGSAWNSTYTLPSGSVLLSGVTAATAATGDNSTLVATTAFVNAEIANDAPTKAGGGATGTWAISITGDAGGNAATATALQTARTINGVSFNGSANITVEPYIEDDESTNATRYIVFTDDSSAGHKRLNEDSSLSYNPSTNTLTAGTFNGSLTGNASSATTATTATTANALTTSRTISLGGDLSGSTSFDGSGNVTISATIGANSVALSTDTTGNYVGAGATSGNGISGSVSNEGGTFTVSSNATNANTANTIVYRDASGNFSAGTITATLNGNASTATSATSASSAATLTNARTINGVSFNGSANIITNPSSTSGAAYSNGYGGRYVSTGSPTGGSNGDIWYKVA